MKAISLWQPHASLLVGGVKQFETRSWKAPRSLIGQRIAIHASKNSSDLEDLAQYVADHAAGRTPFGVDHTQIRAYLDGSDNLGFERFSDLPRGAIVGTAVLEDCIPAEELADPGPFGDFSPGRFAWRMRDPVVFREPISFRGKQGFFNVPDQILEMSGGDAIDFARGGRELGKRYTLATSGEDVVTIEPAAARNGRPHWLVEPVQNTSRKSKQHIVRADKLVEQLELALGC